MNEQLDSLTAEDVVRMLALEPHPEGGFYKETFRDAGEQGGRAHSTAIYYLLRDGEVSHWHRVDSAEVWHWYGGGTIILSVATADGSVESKILGGNLLTGERPQIIVPPGAWQSAKGRGEWTLVGCSVAPGFEFSAFELAPEGWSP